jgi:tetratricopeptide (TPR) repeat protein
MSALLLAMLMQIGPDPHVYPQTPLPGITQQRKDAAPHVSPPPSSPTPADPMVKCLALGRDDAEAGEAYAREWLARAKSPADRAAPDQCLGLILSDTGDFAGAQAAFADAVAATPAAQGATTVPVMAMAGNAALAAGDAAGALAWFDRALAVKDYADAPARAAILTDRARALVALGRNADAANTLADARKAAPNDAAVFLLSATLARRGHDLAAAQGFIETAGTLDQHDPAIGLEAGVIAVLSGHEGAARKSWNSVIAVAPATAEAETARGYLAQLGPDPAAPLDPHAAAPTSTSGASAAPTARTP